MLLVNERRLAAVSTWNGVIREKEPDSIREGVLRLGSRCHRNTGKRGLFVQLKSPDPGVCYRTAELSPQS